MSDHNCATCFYYQLGCQCENLMAAGCIEETRTQKDTDKLICKLEQFLEVLKKQKAKA